MAFLQGEGKPAFHFCIKTRFHAQVDGAVQQRAGRCHPQITFADNVLNLRIFLGKIGAPDVTTIDQTRRQQPVRRQALVQFSNVIFTMYEVNMQTLNRQRSNRVEIWRYAFKIGGQQQFHLSLERVVSGFVCVQPRLW